MTRPDFDFINVVAYSLPPTPPSKWETLLESDNSNAPEWYKDAQKELDMDYPYGVFLELKKSWLSSKQYTEEEFYEAFDEEACSDWTKMGPDGECYGKQWEDLRDEFEEKGEGSWWDSIRKLNCHHLYQLKTNNSNVSHDFILKTVDIGCILRYESVPYSRKWVEWMEYLMEKLE